MWSLDDYVAFGFVEPGGEVAAGGVMHESGTGGVFTDCLVQSGPLKLVGQNGPDRSVKLGKGAYELVVYERKQSAKEAKELEQATVEAIAEDARLARRVCDSCEASYDSCVINHKKPAGYPNCEAARRGCIGATTCE